MLSNLTVTFAIVHQAKQSIPQYMMYETCRELKLTAYLLHYPQYAVKNIRLQLKWNISAQDSTNMITFVVILVIWLLLRKNKCSQCFRLCYAVNCKLCVSQIYIQLMNISHAYCSQYHTHKEHTWQIHAIKCTRFQLLQWTAKAVKYMVLRNQLPETVTRQPALIFPTS